MKRRPTKKTAQRAPRLRNPAPKRIGSVWTARARVYDGKMVLIGTCMDTPNAIAKMFMEQPKAKFAAGYGESVKPRSAYQDRMAAWNDAESEYVKGAPVRNPARRKPTARRRNPARRATVRAPLTYDAVAAMGGAEINKRLDVLDRESSAITNEFIAAGRGYERPSERRHKTDPLSLRDAQNSHDRYVLHAEIARRYGPGAPSRLPSRAARTIRTRNPSRRRNPSPRPRTYAEARADILRALRADGWDVRDGLKVPHATHPSGDFRLWFKTQAIYFTTGDRRRGQGSLGDAYSLHLGDIRAMSTADALAYIDRERKEAAHPRQNPSPRQNQEWRAHHESAAVQASVVKKDYAMAAHHYGEAAKYVAGKPRLVAYYRKEAEKYRSLAKSGK